MHSLPRIILSAAVAFSATACFTGIESTKKITGSDVKSSGAGKESDEQAFAALIASEPPASWHKGKAWQVSDSKISIIFTAEASAQNLQPGDTLSLESVDRVSSVSGVDGVQITFRASDGKLLSYKPEVIADDYASRTMLDIPFAVELTPVEVADSLMRGHTYYITTPRWFNASGQSEDGLRHVPVTVQSVTAGTAVYPLKVAFTTEADSAIHYALMTYGSSPAATRNFDTLFSFTNPRARYPKISDENWQLIIRSKVAEGMSRDECKLALGTPSDIVRGASQSAQLERWTYGDGIYLIFEDGVLTRFRK